MKVIFLDIDGVLNNSRTVARTPQGFIGISSSLTTNLRHLCIATNAKIVLTSTWKDGWKNGHGIDPEGMYLHRKLNQKGLYIMDKTDDPHGDFFRGFGILSYMESHPVESYLVLDDFDFDYSKYPELMKHFIHVNPIDGLTKMDVQKGINILNAV